MKTASTELKMRLTASVSPEEVLALPEEVLSRFDSEEYTCLPGFFDAHVHFREPGFSYKETIRTGSLAAAHGGFTGVAAMPNLNPVPDSLPHLEEELTPIRRDAAIFVSPYGALTVGEKGTEASDIEGMAPFVFAFSDDGKGVQDEGMMRDLMARVRETGKVLAAHCEVNALLHGGVIHDGAFAAAHGYPGISSASEWKMIERDLRLAAETGCPYHVCHISAKESVSLIRDAKASGVDVTCETAPHYLVFCDEDLAEEGRYKMNPPVRGREDREALIEGIADGTVDMIATDHAPHSAEEKAKGLSGSPFGVVGLETAFPAVYTHLVLPGIVTLDRAVGLMSSNPRKRFGVTAPVGFSVWDLNETEKIDPASFLSMGKATPFAYKTLTAVNHLTAWNGIIVYRK
ncbi:MAG: dihydroorotase [Lachnospiraceae bacterium]|nr:dihydroorotase [Lachnospiraceae bacterium]